MHNIRTKLVSGAVSLALAYGVLASGTAHAVDRVRWAVPMAFGSNLTALGDTMPWVAQVLDKMSSGAIKLSVQEPGKLIPALAVFDNVSTGKVEAGYTWMGYEIGKLPASALFGATPFGLEPDEYIAWYYFGGGDKLVKELYAPHNVVPIFCGTISPEAAGWFKFEIKNVEQLKGLKFRAAGLGGKVAQKVGMSVTLLPARRALPGAREGRARRHRVLAADGRRAARLLQGREVLPPAGLAPAVDVAVPVRPQEGLGRAQARHAGDDRDRVHRRRHDGDRQGRGAAGRR